MRLLIDTHALLWFLQDVGKLTSVAEEVVTAADSEVYLSIASVWELSIKYALGSLKLPCPPDQYIERVQSEAGIALLPIKLEHVLAVAGMEQHHRDPFDRLLIAQARLEGLKIISGDTQLDAYGVERIW